MPKLFSDEQVQAARERLRRALSQPLGMMGGPKDVLTEAQLRERLRANRATDRERE